VTGRSPIDAESTVETVGDGMAADPTEAIRKRASSPAAATNLQTRRRQVLRLSRGS